MTYWCRLFLANDCQFLTAETDGNKYVETSAVNFFNQRFSSDPSSSEAGCICGVCLVLCEFLPTFSRISLFFLIGLKCKCNLFVKHEPLIHCSGSYAFVTTTVLWTKR